ncbi:class I SAM-dependent methyltransferase [Waterburya agarophytonicola K14]|uniref:Class I SAM-dependent methyltransferase n=1 Tax=Waterburya agarophytonicola KI4 TaxID=2874699 RepID=A0A964C034_9CYAN|nr:class I SAM-dependent methyltransferase [Waterburya agarophytonicola]MCC0179912.1 class I SAM-dependent methyltransferase [Waterburya agarophytonicola KI4]
MISQPKLKSTISVSTSKATVYTARDFSGYTLQHLKAMYPHSWQEAAFYFGINSTISTESEVSEIKQTAIKQQIWDFFPTPTDAIAKILEVAQLDPKHLVLEPSAGSGDLASAIAASGIEKIDCFELQPLLQKALKLQGFNLIGTDFLTSSPQPIYDRILANPPFGNNGVTRHTQHAYKFLKPGGKLVTLAHHYQLQPSKRDRDFFDWLKSVQARFLNLSRAFQKSDRPTSVPIQLIAIDKPA